MADPNDPDTLPAVEKFLDAAERYEPVTFSADEVQQLAQWFAGMDDDEGGFTFTPAWKEFDA